MLIPDSGWLEIPQYCQCTGGIPANMPEGEYDVLLFLADPEQRLHDNPDYAIRLANNNCGKIPLDIIH